MDGLEFDTFEELHCYVLEHCRQEGVKFNITDCRTVDTANKRNKGQQYPSRFKYSYVKFACKHYGEVRIKSSGLRPNQKSIKIGCKAFIYSAVDRSKGKFVIVRSNLNHNHGVSKDIFVSYNTREGVVQKPNPEDVCMLSNLCTPPSPACEIIAGQSGHSLSKDDIQTIQQSARLNEGFKNVLDVIQDMVTKDDNCAVIFGTNGDGEIRGIYFQTGTQRATLLQFPQVVYIDFVPFSRDMSLHLYCALIANNCQELVPVAYAILSDGESDCVRFFLERLRDVNQSLVKDTTLFMVNQSFLESSILSEIYPSSKVQLNTFHVTKALNVEIENLDVSIELQTTIKACIHCLLYAKTKDLYMQELEYLRQVAPEEFVESFLKNWDSCSSSWAMHAGNTIEDETVKGNSHYRNERHLNELAKMMQKGGSIASLIKEIRKRMVELSIYKNLDILVNNESKLFDAADPAFVRRLQEVASSYAADELSSQFSQALELKDNAVVTSLNLSVFNVAIQEGTERVRMFLSPPQCSCSFSVSTRLPCTHVFLVLLGYNILFESGWIPRKWWLVNHSTNSARPSDSSKTISSATKGERLRTIRRLNDDIKRSCLEASKEVFEERVQQLTFIRDAWSVESKISVKVAESP